MATGVLGAGELGEFVLGDSERVSTPTPSDGPTLGPCQAWIDGDDVATCVSFEYGSNPAVFDLAALEASMALFEISGRIFPGVCERSVRPCRLNCPCWLGGSPAYGFGPYWWTGTPYGVGAGWAWYNEVGDRFGCQPMSRVHLAGYPVRNVSEVLIDGIPLPEFDADTGARNWRLDKWRYLTRCDQPAVLPSTIATPRFWPGCQNMSLDPDQPGTFEITYTWGASPPPLGLQAASELAIQLWLACGGNEKCVLPAGVTKVTRQGIEIERGLLANWLDPTKGTGLVAVDMFLQAYAGGMKRGRRSAVWSPDLQTLAQKLGT